MSRKQVVLPPPGVAPMKKGARPKVEPPSPEFWSRQLEQPSGEDLYHTWRQYGPGSVGDTFSRR
jgi:hypothetical protein